jgi:MFS family permease
VGRPSRIFYGWWIVAVGALSLLMHNGMAFYGYAAFLPQYVGEFGDRTAIAGVGTFLQVVMGLSAPFFGWATDRIGPRFLLAAGGGLLGLGLVAISRAEAIWQLFLAYGILALGSSGTSMVVVGPALAHWFVRRRALAVGLAATFLSLGGTIFLPLDTRLIEALGWRGALVALAFVVWIGLIPPALIWMRRRPADLGLAPDGAPPPRAGAGPARPAEGFSTGRALRTGAYWAVVVAFNLLIFGMTGFLLHQIAYLTDRGFAQGEAALALSLTTSVSVVSRVILGFFADRVSKKYMVAGCMVLQAGAIGGMVAYPERWAIYVGMAVVGLTLAAFGVLQPLIFADFFGTAHLGAILGTVHLFTAVFTGFGSTFAGLLREATGSYGAPFLAFALLDLIAAGVILTARRPDGERGASGAA